jgi:hypothetical protein
LEEVIKMRSYIILVVLALLGTILAALGIGTTFIIGFTQAKPVYPYLVQVVGSVGVILLIVGHGFGLSSLGRRR